MSGIQGSGQAPKFGYGVLPAGDVHDDFREVSPPAEQSQTSQASSATMQHDQPRPALRRTPSGRGVSGDSVMALRSPLKEIAMANPLPSKVFNNFGKQTIFDDSVSASAIASVSNFAGRYNQRHDDARKFINAHGAEFIINYGDKSKGKNNPMSGQSASSIVNSQLKDAGIPLSVDLNGQAFTKLAKKVRESS